MKQSKFRAQSIGRWLGAGLVLVSLVAQGATLTWTNTNGGSWSTPENWDGNQVPGAGDTAVITSDGSYAVTLDGWTTVDSVIVGGGAGAQSLVINSGLSCANLTVSNGAVLGLSGGGTLEAGQAQVSGTLNWQDGELSGAVTIATNGVLHISGDTTKTLLDGMALTNYGQVTWTGLGLLNGEDDYYGPGHPAIYNQAGGVFELDNDSTLQAMSWDYNPNEAVVFVNAGTLRKAAGAGTTYFSSVQFQNGGTVDVEQGTLALTGGYAGELTSSGLFQVQAGAAVQLIWESCTFLPGHLAQGDGFFGVADGSSVTLQGQLTGRFDWSGGSLGGQWTIATNGVLNISGDATKTLQAGAGLANYGLVRWSGLGALNGQDDYYGPGHPAIYNQAGGVFELDSDSTLQAMSTSYNPNQAVVFVNAGTLRKVAGAGTTYLYSVQFQNSGTVDVEQGTLAFTGGYAGELTSSGLFQVQAGAAVQLVWESCTLLPGHQVQGDGLFGVADGSSVTLQGQLAGRFDWTGGSLGGQWTIATNGVLNISGDTIKTLQAGAVLTNYGLVRWSGTGLLNGEDDYNGPGHPAIYNQAGGVFEIDNDSTLEAMSWGYNPNEAVVFVNAGTVRKVAGAGTTYLFSVQFQNSGTVDVEQGTLAFTGGYAGDLTSSGLFQVQAGAAVQLVWESCTFLPGHQAQGDGLFGVADGSSVTLQGQLAGRFDWTGGSLGGQWTIATNGVLNISGDTIKTLQAGGVLTNYGLLRWSGTGLLNGEDDYNGPGHPAIYNQAGGVFEIDNDSTLEAMSWSYNPNEAVVFVNAGTLRKEAGAGTTYLFSVQFQNSGTVDVEQGTLAFTGGYAGELTSSGLFQVQAGAAVQLVWESCTLLPGHQVQGDGLFGVADGSSVTLQGQLAGRFDWTGGSLGGQWTVAPNGVLNISGDTIKTLQAGAVLTNYGLVRWSGTGLLNGEDDYNGPGHPAIYNQPGGVFEIDNDSTLEAMSWSYNPNEAVVFVNAGTLRKVAGAGTTYLFSVQFQNSGTVDVEQGTLAFTGGYAGELTSSGLFQVQAGAAVQLVWESCTLLPGHLAQGEGLFGVVDGSSVTLEGQLAGRFDWTGGSLGGQWTVATNGVLNISGDTSKGLLGSVTNSGTINWSGSGLVTANNGGLPGATQGLWNQPEGTINLTDDVQLGNAGGATDFEIYNGGLLRKLAGGGTAVFDNVLFANAGSLEVWSGTLALGGEWLNSGTVRIAVSGPSNYSMIQSYGDATLNGALELEFQNGYLPGAGDSFGLLGLASTNAGLSSLSSVPTLASGLYLSSSVNAGQLVVAVHQEPTANPDSFTVNEETPTDLDVLANDINMYNGGAIVSYTAPAHGTLSLNPNNTLHYVPVNSYFGADAFTYQARNADGKLASTSVSLQILEVNHAPVVAPVADQTVDELTLVSFQVVASDVEGDQLTFTLSGAPDGAAIAPGTGVFTWTPTEAQGPGVYPMTVTVTDNGAPNLSASRTFTITVREVNTAPSLSPVADQTVPELQPFSLQLAATDSDIPANTLTFLLVSGPAGLAVTPAGLVSWTPSEAQGPSTNRVTVAVKDDGQPSMSSTQSFQVVVLEVNTAPVLPLQTNRVMNELTLLVVTNTATDSDLPANVLTYTLLNPPAGAAIDTNGIITWTPTEAQGPSSNLLVTVVTDNGQPPLSTTNSFVVLVNEVNSAPTLNPVADQTVPELQAFNLQLSATDPDLPANTLTYFLVSGPAGLAVSPTGLITWTPTEAQGPSANPVTVAVKDDGQPSMSSTQSFQVVVLEVNTAPVLPLQTNRVMNELTLLVVTNTATDSDLPANVLTYTLLNPPVGAAIDTNGIISWTPTEAQGPSSNLLVTVVTDNGQPPLSTTNSFVVLVNEVNSAPTLNPVADQIVPELQAFNLQLLATDPDLPANTLTYFLVSGPAGLAVSPAGLITWTPTEAEGPSANPVTVAVKDDGQPSMSSTQSFQVVVLEVNTAPVLPLQTNRVMNELTLLVVTNTATDSDLPANVLTYTLLNPPVGAAIDTNGIITWTPSEAQGPSSNLLVTVVTDNGQPPLSTTNSFVVLVNEVNLPPSLSPVGPQTIAELTPLSLQLVATDPDLPANHLTFGLVSGPTGLSVSAAGLVTWTPSEAQGPSTNQVVVQVTDDGIPSLSATQSFTVVVSEVNTAPVLAALSNQAVVPAQMLALSFSATDSDLPTQTLSFSLDAAPVGASVTSAGVFTWTPGFDQAGTTNTVVVRVTDNGTPPLSSTRSFSIAVLNTGLKADYFAGTNFDTLALTRDDAQVNFDWSTGSPGPGVPTNQFSVRWTGQVIPRYSQTYTFYTVSDDGVALWVNGQPLINNWTVHLATTNTATIALTAGQGYVLRLEYYDASGSAVSRLMWSSTSQAKEIVPTSQLLCNGYSDLISNAVYRLTPKLATGRSMEVASGATADGSQVDINNWKAATYQEWQAVGVGSNYFKLVPQHVLSKVLEVNGGFTTNGTKVQLATDNGTSRQRFTSVDMGQGWFKLQPLTAPASVLDLKGGASGNGTVVQLYQDNGADSQRWRLDRQ